MNDRETVAAWMMGHGYATGHGDTIEDMLFELSAQAGEHQTAYNLLRDALSWFDAHTQNHLPQWVVSARALLNPKTQQTPPERKE